MSDLTRDDGLTAPQLWGTSWVLAFAGLGCFVRVLAFTVDGRSIDRDEAMLWLALCLGLWVFSAACAAIGAVKGAEGRLRAEMQYLTQREVKDS